MLVQVDIIALSAPFPRPRAPDTLLTESMLDGHPFGPGRLGSGGSFHDAILPPSTCQTPRKAGRPDCARPRRAVRQPYREITVSQCLKLWRERAYEEKLRQIPTHDTSTSCVPVMEAEDVLA